MNHVVTFCFFGADLWAASTHIDKYLVEKYFKNSDTAVLMVFTAFIGLLMLRSFGYSNRRRILCLFLISW